jgi:hypothetical protein
VQPATATTSSVTFVEGTAPCKAIAPSSDIGTNWRGGNEPAFLAAGGDSTWTSGTQGVGYENDSTPSSTNVPYTPFIGLNLKTAMFNSKATAYIRIPFNVANAALVKTLNLQIRYDDGYAAFINGVQIASDLSPSTLAYNSTSSGNTVDSTAAVYRPYDVTASAGLLKNGQNILAIHIMNGSTGSSDLLSQAILSGTIYSASPTPAKIYWRVRTQ